MDTEDKNEVIILQSPEKLPSSKLLVHSHTLATERERHPFPFEVTFSDDSSQMVHFILTCSTLHAWLNFSTL